MIELRFVEFLDDEQRRELDRAFEADPLRSASWFELASGTNASIKGVLVRDDGVLVGYGELSAASSGWTAKYALFPSSMLAPQDAATALIDALSNEAAREGGGRIALWCQAATDADDAHCRQAGFEVDRELLLMRRSLGSDLPARDGAFSLRAFRPGSDEEGFVELNNAAFEGHPEQGGWRRSTVADLEHEPWFDAAGFLLHEEQGRLAAAVWTKIEAHDTSKGELFVIVVHPDFQGKGLGRKIVVAALAHLVAVGCSCALLYVDAANVPAISLYRSLGFVTMRHDRAYVALVRATS